MIGANAFVGDDGLSDVDISQTTLVPPSFPVFWKFASCVCNDKNNSLLFFPE